MPNEPLVARAVGHRGNVLWEKSGTSMRALMDAADREAPTAWHVSIRDDHTSDGTYFGPGRGRVMASRQRGDSEPRGPGGWLIETHPNKAEGEGGGVGDLVYVIRFPTDFHAGSFVAFANEKAGRPVARIKPKTTATVLLRPPEGVDLQRITRAVQGYSGVISDVPIVWKGRMVPGGLRPAVRRDYRGRGNAAVGGRLTPEERSSLASKRGPIEEKVEARGLEGFALTPANDVSGHPGTVWVHREPDGGVVVRKIGGNFFVRIDREGDAHSARVWLIGDPPRLGRVETSRKTLDSAIHWAKQQLTRDEREEGVRQRMAMKKDEDVAAGEALSPGQVVRFREEGARRRYVVATVNHFGSGEHAWTDYSLRALSGGERGSGPSGVRRHQLILDRDQSVVFTGAQARKLEGKYNTARVTARAYGREG